MLLKVIVAVRQPRRPGQVVAHEAQHDAHDVGRRAVRPEDLGQELRQLAPPPLPPAQVRRDDGVRAVAAAPAVLAAAARQALLRAAAAPADLALDTQPPPLPAPSPTPAAANGVSASGAVGDVSASAKHVSVLDFGFLPLLPQLALVLAAAHALALGEVTKGKTGQTGLPRAALCELYARKNRGAMRKPAICQTHIYTR